MPNNRDYKSEAITLKWVKLRESDAIVKMVDELGCLLEGVARGARKPKNSISSKLEPFNCVEVFLTKGRGIDVIKDCRTIQINESLRDDPCKFSCASCVSELLCKSLQPGIDVPKMFDLTKTYLETMKASPDDKRLCLTSATLLKAATFLGYMPSFCKCVYCGQKIDSCDFGHFSFEEGGSVCRICAKKAPCLNIDRNMIANANSFLHMTLSDIIASNANERVGTDVMKLAYMWIKAQMSISLKSYPLAIEICSC